MSLLQKGITGRAFFRPLLKATTWRQRQRHGAAVACTHKKTYMGMETKGTSMEKSVETGVSRPSRKRTVAHTVDEFRTILRDLSAKPSKKPRHARHHHVPAYATPCDDTDVFDMLPNEMVREVLMRVDCWRDVVAFQATARRFASVLAPCDTWTRKYAPTTPYDLTMSARTRDTGEPNLVADDKVALCDDEPLEAFVAVHARWGMAAKGFDVAGLCRLAAAGRTDALLWLDARVYQMYGDVGIAPASDDYLGASFVEPAVLRCRGRYARAAAAAGQSDTLAAVLAAHVSLAAHGEKIMQSALESNCAATVDVVHAFARSHDGQYRAHKWCHNGFGPVPPSSPLASSTAPLSVLTHLATRGCPMVPKPTIFAMAMTVSKGLLRVAAWLDGLPEVQARPHELRRCSRRDVDRAAGDGHYAVVQWAHERGIRRCALSTLLSGIRSGHAQGRVDFVRWALAEDPLWPHGIDTTEGQSGGAGDVAAAPAAGPWTGPPSTGPRRSRPARVPEWRDGLLAIEAAKAGALDVVQWLYETHPEMVSIEAARAAASACNADIAIYLHEVGVAPLTAYPCLRRASERIPDTERRSRQSVDRVAGALDKLAAAGAPTTRECWPTSCAINARRRSASLSSTIASTRPTPPIPCRVMALFLCCRHHRRRHRHHRHHRPRHYRLHPRTTGRRRRGCPHRQTLCARRWQPTAWT
ncbi:hypothetical protein TW95_gp0082 [Pandoravirus inopinatum]|uniref:Ankyrin repeat protein n=1 Tax=Pandoravirus inopinatum TaxID=1605721 RepID=A0A0B5J7S8_9VIRU|nr:hypothetical protein TW95_gp0082 [Pandoravirus inopinatum]AJF96816.1 hypothetical protein [Pandoravirus inopinatum]